jgi:hypothetical protein
VTTQPPAGWYQDPVGPPTALRYWDGLAWTAHVAASPPPDRSGARPPPIGSAASPIEIRVLEPAPFLKFLQVAYEESKGWNPQPIEGSRWPVVIAVNRFGQDWQLCECETMKKANVEAAQVRADLAGLGLRDWCEKYGVPWSFVTA